MQYIKYIGQKIIQQTFFYWYLKLLSLRNKISKERTTNLVISFISNTEICKMYGGYVG